MENKCPENSGWDRILSGLATWSLLESTFPATAQEHGHSYPNGIVRPSLRDFKIHKAIGETGLNRFLMADKNR